MISTAAEFVKLRSSEDPAEYGRAAHDEAPESVWTEVIRDFPEMRTWVAHNKTVPLSILEVLACDHDPSVRSTVATKRKLSAELQRKLAADADASVRARLAHNAKCDASILRLLSQDSEAFVRDAAESRLKESGDAL